MNVDWLDSWNETFVGSPKQEKRPSIDTKQTTCQVCGKSFLHTGTDHDQQHMIEIVPHLYLGGKWNACNMDELVYFNIVHIVNATYDVENFFHDAFTYKKLQWDDSESQDILENVSAITAEIHSHVSNKKNVLCHCYFGRSRSVSVIIAYLMQYHSMTYDESLKTIRSKKENASPNLGFESQLRKIENIH